LVASRDPATEITQHGSEDAPQVTALCVPQAQWFFPVLKGRTQGFARRDCEGDRLFGGGLRARSRPRRSIEPKSHPRPATHSGSRAGISC